MASCCIGQAAADVDEIQPAPASIGTDIPTTYFGPAPSSVQPELLGPLQLLTAGQLDVEVATITLPLYHGKITETGEDVWYIVTDTDDEANAAALGINFSAKLTYAENCRAVRTAAFDIDGTLMFDFGAVDFSPERVVVPGKTVDAEAPAFPPAQFSPGSIGDELYSPLVQIANAGGHIYNAPMVSLATTPEQLEPYCDGISEEEGAEARAILHDKVVNICPGENGAPGTVTLALTPRFSFGRPVLYLSTDASVGLAATLEGAVLSAAMGQVPVGRDDSLFSAVERIFAFTNGPTNVPFEDEVEVEVNPQRQGFNSAIVDGGGPLNILGGIPTVTTDYSPLWDLNIGEWTQEAVDNGYRSRMTGEFDVLGMVLRGFVTGPGGSPYGSSGIIINCPIVHRFL